MTHTILAALLGLDLIGIMLLRNIYRPRSSSHERVQFDFPSHPRLLLGRRLLPSFAAFFAVPQSSEPRFA